jgi:2-oxoglutarate ferredoxin oxidoreductase subunit alpha
MSTQKVINDFSITVGTVNGSGSSTANTTLLRALFKMGIPVSENLFPSNIQGLPTWYTIRISKVGFTARRDEQEIVVAMNDKSFNRDLATVLPGGAFFYNEDIKLPISRADISIYPMPVKAIVRKDPDIQTIHDLVGNMVCLLWPLCLEWILR